MVNNNNKDMAWRNHLQPAEKEAVLEGIRNGMNNEDLNRMLKERFHREPISYVSLRYWRNYTIKSN